MYNSGKGSDLMKLEDIGFYTLCDERARTASETTPLYRCELILTDACNFKCPYCRGLRSDLKGTMPIEKAKSVVDLWAKDGLKNIRLSGGEPTIYKGIVDLVAHIKGMGIKRIAMSTNGSADISAYRELIDAGINDFSISLDACCSAYGDLMAGGIAGAWDKVIENIKTLSKLVYVTVGVVVTEETIDQLPETVLFASSLGVSDIRIISAAQFNKLLDVAQLIPEEVYKKYPILKYRLNNINRNRNVRGLESTDSHQCGLLLDDMAVSGEYHFPCIIYMREGGNPIGKVGKNMRRERADWVKTHDTHKDPICLKNCLDVCIDYNNKHERALCQKTRLPAIDSSLFTWERWQAGSIHTFGIECRYNKILEPNNADVLRKYAVGWCHGENLGCRPKTNESAVMFEFGGEKFWFHLRNNEFVSVFGGGYVAR
jgi:MoaA/NifB/PqqE/SkfB family radical SAM enzyme